MELFSVDGGKRTDSSRTTPLTILLVLPSQNFKESQSSGFKVLVRTTLEEPVVISGLVLLLEEILKYVFF